VNKLVSNINNLVLFVDFDESGHDLRGRARFTDEAELEPMWEVEANAYDVHRNGTFLPDFAKAPAPMERQSSPYRELVDKPKHADQNKFRGIFLLGSGKTHGSVISFEISGEVYSVGHSRIVSLTTNPALKSVQKNKHTFQHFYCQKFDWTVDERQMVIKPTQAESNANGTVSVNVFDCTARCRLN